MDNESIRASVALRLGAKICEPHRCPCGEQVDIRGLHGLTCKRAAGRLSRHNYLNDLIWRALIKAGIPSIKEPSSLIRTDGKRPDGLTQIPWVAGRCATWDVTVTDTLAISNLPHSSTSAGAAAEKAAERKTAKYSELAATYTFIPVAFETLGPVNTCGADFIKSIGARIRSVTGDLRETSFLFQRLSSALQRFNASCLLGTFDTSGDG